MRTKLFLAALVLAVMAGGEADAQRFLDRLGRRVQNRAEEGVIRKAEQAVDKAIDKATDADTYKGDGSDDQQQQAPPPQQQQAPTAGTTATGTAPETAPAQAPQQSLEMTYAKSDFVPGDEIFFEDDMAGEKLGEFPSMWDLEYGNAEIAQINGVKCISMIGYTVIMPLMQEKNYLPEVFTVEFDMLVDNSNTTWAQGEIGFNDGRVFVPRTNTSKDKIRLYGNWLRPDDKHGNLTVDDIPHDPSGWDHVAISFNKRACKYYINGVRYLNIPNMKQPNSIWFWTENGNYYIKNVRLAKGAVPLYDRMMSDGKFITYGITFDVGKATIKPESMGEINRIVTLMNENPDLRFSVEGHTDSTGNAASNQTLSEQRSEAIVAKLVELGIAADRLTASGKGATNPIADNSTDEGRAKNRRVEFVKL